MTEMARTVSVSAAVLACACEKKKKKETDKPSQVRKNPRPVPLHLHLHLCLCPGPLITCQFQPARGDAVRLPRVHRAAMCATGRITECEKEQVCQGCEAARYNGTVRMALYRWC